MRLLLLITAALVMAAGPACADPISTALVAGVTALGTAGTVGGAIGTFLVNTALATGFSYLARAVMPKSSTKASASTSQQTLNLTINADLPRQLVLGARAVGGSLHYFCKFGPQNENVDLIIVLADHEIASLEKLWVNGIGVSMHIDENGYQDVPEFHDKYGISMLSFRLYKGTPGQPADAEVIGDSGGQWTSGHTLSGCAYVKVRLVFNPDVWGGELPTFLWLVRGAKLYDPRKDSTMPGGFGAHRWGSPETYEFADSLELCRYNYLCGIYNNGDRWFGVGLAADEIDTAKSIAAMNACEEMVLCRDGTYEPRYRCAAVIDADEDHASVLAKFSTACAGSMPDLSGMYALQPGVAQIPVIGFTDADLIDGADLTGSRYQSLGDVANEVTGTWADVTALYQSGSVPTRFSYDDEALDGGYRRSAAYDLSFIYSQSQGQRCLEIYRRLARRQITHTLTLRRRYAVLEAGDWITWTSDKFGYVDGVFRVEALTLNDDWTVTLQIRQIDDAVYAWSVADELDPANPTSLPSAGPPADIVVNVQVATAQVNSVDGTQVPGIRVTWNPITDPTVYGLVIEYRRVGDAPWQTYVAGETQVREGTATITAGIVGGDFYQVRITALTSPRRVVDVSAIATTSSNTVEVIVNRALVSAVAEAVQPGSITNDALAALTRQQFDKAVMDLDAATVAMVVQMVDDDARLSLLSRATGKLSADVAAGLNPLSAGIERIDQVQAAMELAIAQTQTTLDAQIAGVATELTIEESARASADNALTTQITTASAQLGDAIAVVQDQIEAIATASETTARDTYALSVVDLQNADDAAVAAFVEAVARGAGDAELRQVAQFNSAGIQEVRTATVANGAAIATIQTNLTAETSARQAAIQTVQQARADGDAAVASQMTALVAQETAARGAAILTETSARVAGDNASAAAISTLVTQVNANTAAISTETTARTNADSGLSSSITTALARANGASATGQFGIVATAGDLGAAVSYSVMLQAGSVWGGMRFDVMSGGSSRILLHSGSFQLWDASSGFITPAFDYSGGYFALNGNVRVNGNLVVTGSISSAQISEGANLGAQGIAAASQNFSTGATDWFYVGSEIVLNTPTKGGYTYPMVHLRWASSVTSLGGSSGSFAQGSYSFRILCNGVVVYEVDPVVSYSVGPSTGAGQGATDFFYMSTAGTQMYFQLQFKHNMSSVGGAVGNLFLKVAASAYGR
ncbi:hypothetical protein [Azorhizobium doebereinerae]|uniref:hypothetical protein n=1 Tax=Azorhizobium doebereinerae TaxID=281091 RepID=UPI000415920E|nr:hypothetical protein [Azorhizobium doebereinerae]